MNLIICISVFVLGLVLLVLNALQYILLKPKSKQTNVLSLYLTVSAIEGVICFCLFFVFPNNNFFLSHIFFTIQLFFISYFYYNLFQSKKEKNYVKFGVIFVFLISAIQYIINPQSFWQFNLIEIVSISCLLISFGLLYIYNTLNEKKIYFYFSIGMIMYFLCACIVYLCGGLTLVFLQDPYVDHWILKDLFFIVFQILIWKEINHITNTQNVQ